MTGSPWSRDVSHFFRRLARSLRAAYSAFLSTWRGSGVLSELHAELHARVSLAQLGTPPIFDVVQLDAANPLLVLARLIETPQVSQAHSVWSDLRASERVGLFAFRKAGVVRGLIDRPAPNTTGNTR